MKKMGFYYIGLLLLSMSFVVSADATGFWVSGKIKRTLVEQNYYGGCMVFLDKDVGNACPSRWVSLDCKGLFYGKDPEIGKKMFSSALAAAHAGNTVSLLINDTVKVNTYCVARRIDVVF